MAEQNKEDDYGNEDDHMEPSSEVEDGEENIFDCDEDEENSLHQYYSDIGKP
jgi:hypothetical protein